MTPAPNQWCVFCRPFLDPIGIDSNALSGSHRLFPATSHASQVSMVAAQWLAMGGQQQQVRCSVVGGMLGVVPGFHCLFYRL